MTIDRLSDDVLLLIFHFDQLEDQEIFPYLDGLRDLNGLKDLNEMEYDYLLSLSWHRLVHVCQRWRSLVFASPNTLDLRLVCDAKTRVELTGIWPPLPITIRTTVECPIPEDYDFNAAMVHPNRVCEIRLLHLTISQLQRLASAMQEPFPALIHLKLGLSDSYTCPASTIPDGFLGGSAPRLQSLMLHSIPFHSIPRLLLSATALVRLTLWDIPHSGYFEPEAIVASLVVMANLKSLTIGSSSPHYFPDRESRRPPTHTFLPALIHFEFRGVSRYLEDLLARINAPLLNSFFITFLYQLVFDLPQLVQFMERTTKFQALNETHVDMNYNGIRVESSSRTSEEMSGFSITCEEFNWRLSSMAQVLESFFPSLYVVEHLYIYGSRYYLTGWQHDVEIFYPFTFVKNPYLSKKFTQFIAPALKELVEEAREGVVDVLPALETLFFEEPQPSGAVTAVWDSIGLFVVARKLLGHPVAVSHWNKP